MKLIHLSDLHIGKRYCTDTLQRRMALEEKTGKGNCLSRFSLLH